jgi:Ca2+-binding RTX toxin-like protein
VKKTALICRFGVSTIAAGLLVALLSVLVVSARPMQTARVNKGKAHQLLIGSDDDRQDNPAIQAGAVTNQSLNRTDVLRGGSGNDVIFGLNGNDVMDGGPGQDIILGGPDGGAAPGGPPNSDIMFGGQGGDVNLGRPVMEAGPGRDALILAPRIETQFRIQQREFGCPLPCLVFLGFLRAYRPRT